MNIIALDTCTESCSAALLYQGELFEIIEMTQRGHSDLILGMMDSLFQQAGISISAIDVLAFGRGPGSFTGVRVGVGVAQGIAFARDLPVVPVSSLAAVAQTAADKYDLEHIAVAMDARMGEVYTAHYQSESGIVKLIDKEKVCPPEQCIPYDERQWTGVGTGWREYDELLTSQFHSLANTFVACYPTASSVIKLAKIEAEAGRTLVAEQALPVYLRDNVAKKKQDQKKVVQS